MADFFSDPNFRRFTATADRACGDIVMTADGLAGIVQAQRGIKNGETGNVGIEGVVEITKANASDVFAVGDRVQVTIATQLATALDSGPAASTAVAAGTVIQASGNGVPKVLVDLNGRGPVPNPYGIVNHIDLTFTVAQVNAGVTLLPAVPGFRYQLVDEAMIAIGGAAATATSVDLVGVQAATNVLLVANAVAGLTQNTLLRAGAANAAILAAGASFNPCDVNTPLTVSRTGSAVATATSIRVKVWYHLIAE